MPNMNGFELTRRLRADHRTARVPIVMLSAASRPTTSSPATPKARTSTSRSRSRWRCSPRRSSTSSKRMKATAGEVTKRGRVIVFLRGKGGAGATTLAVNSAVALAETKMYKTAVVDLSLEFGNVTSHLNLKPQHTLAALAGTQPDAARRHDIRDLHRAGPKRRAGLRRLGRARARRAGDGERGPAVHRAPPARQRLPDDRHTAVVHPADARRHRHRGRRMRRLRAARRVDEGRPRLPRGPR